MKDVPEYSKCDFTHGYFSSSLIIFSPSFGVQKRNKLENIIATKKLE